MRTLSLAVITLLLTFSSLSHAYKISGGEMFLGGGFGTNVNVVRSDHANRTTPRAELPLFLTFDYAIDYNVGAFLSMDPFFSGSSLGLGFRAGAKYWFTFFNAPYVPYVSLAINPTIMWPTDSKPRHFNLGLSPGIGLNFFVFANFMVGAHVNFKPSIAFIDGHKQFEFAVAGFFDLSFRV